MVEHELIAQIKRYRTEIETALTATDLESLRGISSECDQFMRRHFPESGLTCKDPGAVLMCLNELSEVYQQAVATIERQKAQIGGQLHKITRSRNNTNSYLDVAGNLE